MPSQELIDDAHYAISRLTKEQRETLKALAESEAELESMSLPEIPSPEELREMADRQAIIDDRSRYGELENRISGMKKRLDFIANELIHWNERIGLSASDGHHPSDARSNQMAQQNMQILEYRHPYFSPDWTKLEWTGTQDDLVEELASDWVDDDEDEAEAHRIAEDVEIRIFNSGGIV